VIYVAYVRDVIYAIYVTYVSDVIDVKYGDWDITVISYLPQNYKRFRNRASGFV